MKLHDLNACKRCLAPMMVEVLYNFVFPLEFDVVFKHFSRIFHHFHDSKPYFSVLQARFGTGAPQRGPVFLVEKTVHWVVFGYFRSMIPVVLTGFLGISLFFFTGNYFHSMGAFPVNTGHSSTQGGFCNRVLKCWLHSHSGSQPVSTERRGWTWKADQQRRHSWTARPE